MGNGKWEMEDGRWEMGNGRWEMGNIGNVWVVQIELCQGVV